MKSMSLSLPSTKLKKKTSIFVRICAHKETVSRFSTHDFHYRLLINILPKIFICLVNLIK